MTALSTSVISAWWKPRKKNCDRVPRKPASEVPSPSKLKKGRVRREVQAVQEQQELNAIIKEVWE